MKLIIQIPCLNEEHTLPETLKDLPKSIKEIDIVEILVIDDGSTDRTAEVAKEHGAHHILSLTNNKGLAKAFYYGLNEALKLGADIVVNTDADNQYNAKDIEKLINPILRKKVDIVIGDRRVETISHFSPLKIFLQKVGSWAVRQLSGTRVPDATSGFRAYSRSAAMQMNVVSDFTYTLETIISAGNKNLAITHIPVRTNRKVRESRLFPNIRTYIIRSLVTLVKVYSMHKPLRVFAIVGGVSFLGGVLLGLRYLYYYFQGDPGHVQSVILAGVLLIVGIQITMMGIAAELIAVNRKLLEDVQLRIKKKEMDSQMD